MAVRTPLKLDGSNNLIEMNATDIENIKLEMIRLYGAAPSAVLSVVTSGGLGVASMNDTRYQAGAASSNADAYPTEATTAEPSLVTVTYDRINQADTVLTAPADTNNKAFPVYQSGGNIYAMTLTDMRDTFVDDVVDRLTAVGTTTEQAGTYRIHTATTLTGHTLVSSTPVFVDTRADIDYDGAGADTTAYTAAGIPEALDQPQTITNYYLFRINAAAAGTLPIPLQITAANDLQQYTTTNWRALLQDVIQYYVGNVAGYMMDWGLAATNGAIARGSGMVNTQLTGVTGVWNTRNDTTASLYYAQEFPNGTVSTIETKYLGVTRI